jgi:hypothetical protein
MDETVSLTPPQSATESTDQWQYVAEGHLNVTFTNRNGKIIRLRKEQRHIKKSKYNDDFFDPENSATRQLRSNSNTNKLKTYLIIPNVLQTYNYINLVVTELMPAKWLPSVELYDLSETLFAKLTSKTDTKIDLSEKYALLMDDCAHINDNETIGIEIKPKCGVAYEKSKSLESPDSEDSVTPAGSCRFCLQQRLKLDLKQRNEISRYCPLNLYSNSYSRFHRAILGMITTPQNNLRVFSGSQQFYGDGDSPDNFVNVLQTIGLKNVDEFSNLLWNIIYEEPNDPADQQKIEKSCNAHDNASEGWSFENSNHDEIKRSLFLERILQLQNFDKLGSIKANEIYSDMSPEDETLLSEFDDEFWSSVVKDMKFETENSTKVNNFTENSDVISLAKYLISSTFKDCSIFISLKRKTTNAEPGLNSVDTSRVKEMTVDGVTWLVKLSLVDFDPKPLGKIARYRKLHEDILKINGLEESSIVLV